MQQGFLQQTCASIKLFNENINLPPQWRRASATMELVSFIMMLDPAAFGWTSTMSPDRPMPCPNLVKWSDNGRLEDRQRRCCELWSNSLKHQLQFVKLSNSSRYCVIFVFSWRFLWLCALPPRREFTSHLSNMDTFSAPHRPWNLSVTLPNLLGRTTELMNYVQYQPNELCTIPVKDPNSICH